MSKLLVTGGFGTLGLAIQELSNFHNTIKCFDEILNVNSELCDLRDEASVITLFSYHKPTHVLHLAAKVGGIKDNIEYQYDYLTDNVKINTNVINECVHHKIQKLIFISSACVYPQDSDFYPMHEGMVHRGQAEETNRMYAQAKRLGQMQIAAARTQFGFKNWTTVYSSNFYGPNDHFNSDQAHIIPSLISRFHNAKVNGDKEVTLWGDGKALRQYLYVNDLAWFINHLLENDHKYNEINFAHPQEVSTHELALLIKKVVGFEGTIAYNQKMSGQYRRALDINRAIEQVGSDFSLTSLEIGLQKTYEWYISTLK